MSDMERARELSDAVEVAVLAVLRNAGDWSPDTVLTGWVVLAAGVRYDDDGDAVGMSTEFVPADGRMSWELILGLMRARTLKVEAEYLGASSDD